MSHELGHQILHVYQSCDPLFESDNFAPVYSGVRKTDRPAILSLHAAVALGFMITAFESFGSGGISISDPDKYVAGRLNELRTDLVHTLVSLRKTRMTTLGRELVQELALCCG
jgi:HEXXH motif-containing protein